MATKVFRGKALVAHLRRQPNVIDAEALAAWIGRFKKARKQGLSVPDAKAAAGGKTGSAASASNGSSEKAKAKTINLPNHNKATYDPATKTVSVPAGTFTKTNSKGEQPLGFAPMKQIKAIEDAFPDVEFLKPGDIKPVKFKNIKAAFEAKEKHDAEIAEANKPQIFKTPTHGETASYNPETKQLKLPFLVTTSNPSKAATAVGEALAHFPEAETVKTGTNDPAPVDAVKHALQHVKNVEAKAAGQKKEHTITGTMPLGGLQATYNLDTGEISIPDWSDDDTPETKLADVKELIDYFPNAKSLKIGDQDPQDMEFVKLAAKTGPLTGSGDIAPEIADAPGVAKTLPSGLVVKHDEATDVVRMPQSVGLGTKPQKAAAMKEALDEIKYAKVLSLNTGDGSWQTYDKSTAQKFIHDNLGGKDSETGEAFGVPGEPPEGVIFETPNGVQVYAIPPKDSDKPILFSMGAQGETALYYKGALNKEEVLDTAKKKGITHNSVVTGGYNPTYKEITVKGDGGPLSAAAVKELQKAFPDPETLMFNTDTTTNLLLHKSGPGGAGPKPLFNAPSIGGYAVPVYDAPYGDKPNQVLAAPGGGKVYFDPMEFSGNAPVLDAANDAGIPFKAGGFFSGSYDPNTKHLNLYNMPFGPKKGPGLKKYLQDTFPEAHTATLPDGGNYALKGKPKKNKVQAAKASTPSTPSAPAEPAKLGKGIDEPFDPDKPGGHFDSPTEANNWALEAYRPWVEDSITSSEKASMKHYKGSGYRPINTALRDAQGGPISGTMGMSAKSIQDDVQSIDRAIEKAPPLPDDIVVYRGRLPTPVLEAFEAGAQDGLIGKNISDPAYMSTSMDRGVAKNFSYSSKFPRSIGKITLPKGAKVAHLEGLTHMGEHEMLLPRDAPVKITKAYIDDAGYRVIEAEYVLPENNLENRSLSELRQIAADRGIAFKGLTKAALIAKLRGE